MNLLKRTLTALVLLPLAAAGVLYFPRFWFFVLIQIIILAALVEFYNLPRRKKLFASKGLGILVSLIIAGSFYYSLFFIEMALFISLIAGGVYYLVSVTKLEKLALFPSAIALTYFGALYLSFTLNHVIWLRDQHGPKYIFFLMAVVFVGDTGAMLIGRWLGRHKMAPIASPNKTWEGSIAGLITGAAAGIAFQQLFMAGEATLFKAALFGILVQMVSQISDPLESLFKRAAGVKDSSNLLPGHGGFFDRIDSLILAIPLFYYLLEYIGML
jgi:phosphatidate cytidylyltransferase